MQVGDLSVKIGADTTGLTRGLDQAKSSIGFFDQSLVGAISSIKVWQAAVFEGTRRLAAFVKESMDAVNATADLAKSLNTSYASLVNFNRAAQLTGISNASGLLMIFNKNISDAATGTGPYADALKRLNLTAAELMSLPVDERIKLFGERFAQLIPAAEQAGFATQFFGRQGQTALELLRDTSVITAAQKEMEKLGLALSNIDAEIIGAADDELSIFGLTVKAIGQQLALSFSPAIAEISKRFKELFIDSGFLKGALMALDIGIRLVIAAIRDFWNILNYLPDAIGAVVGKLLKLIALIPGFGKLNELGEGLIKNFEATWKALQGGGAIGRTLSGMDDWYAKWRNVGEAAAKAGYQINNAMPTGLSDEQRKALAERVKAIQDALRTEQQVQADKYRSDVLELQKARDNGVHIEGGYQKTLQEMTAAHIARMNEINANSPEAKKAEELAKNLETLKQSFLTEEELQMQKFAREIEILNQSLEAKYLTEEQWNKMIQDAEARHWDEIYKIRNKGASDVVKMADAWRKKDYQGAMTIAAQMTAGLANQSKEMFNINKAATLAEAVLKAYAAITSSYAWGASRGGPPLGAAMAAVAGAFQFAQIRAIASQQYSGAKSVAPSVAAATPAGATAVADVSGGAGGGGRGNSGQIVNINLTGEIFGRDQVRGLIGQLNEAIADGAILRVQ